MAAQAQVKVTEPIHFDQLNNFDEIFCLLNSNEYCAQPTTVTSDTLMMKFMKWTGRRLQNNPVSGVLLQQPINGITMLHPITGATEQNLTALANGYYQVETDSNGCTAISDVYADTNRRYCGKWILITVEFLFIQIQLRRTLYWFSPTSYIQVDLMSAEGKLLLPECTIVSQPKSNKWFLSDLQIWQVAFIFLKLYVIIIIYYRKIILNHS